MSARYLIDTNVASDIIRARTPAQLRWLEAQRTNSVAISVLTQAELLFGLARKPEAVALRRIVDRFLLDVQILAWDSPAARVYAALRAQRQLDRLPTPEIDMQIAAHALSLNAVLVTRDRVFNDIPGLICEDWSRPALP